MISWNHLSLHRPMEQMCSTWQISKTPFHLFRAFNGLKPDFSSYPKARSPSKNAVSNIYSLLPCQILFQKPPRSAKMIRWPCCKWQNLKTSDRSFRALNGSISYISCHLRARNRSTNALPHLITRLSRQLSFYNTREAMFDRSMIALVGKIRKTLLRSSGASNGSWLEPSCHQKFNHHPRAPYSTYLQALPTQNCRKATTEEFKNRLMIPSFHKIRKAPPHSIYAPNNSNTTFSS